MDNGGALTSDQNSHKDPGLNFNQKHFVNRSLETKCCLDNAPISHGGRPTHNPSSTAPSAWAVTVLSDSMGKKPHAREASINEVRTQVGSSWSRKSPAPKGHAQYQESMKYISVMR